MKIEWKITKKRGNLRPTLSYTFIVDSFEKCLALPPIRICSTIAEPINAWEEHCYPNQYERAENPEYKGFYELSIVPHKGKVWTQEIRLPWRKDNSYPEIESSFKTLRNAFEDELALAYASMPMEEKSFLNISHISTQTVAPAVLAEKFLSFAKQSSGIM